MEAIEYSYTRNYGKATHKIEWKLIGHNKYDEVHTYLKNGKAVSVQFSTISGFKKVDSVAYWTDHARKHNGQIY